jgi:DNA-binding winged helix-turn-helix (wHTH) protein/Tol biopolymer transport system component
MKPRPPVLQFGPFEFDPSQHELRNAGDRTTLPAALNRLLLLFVNRPGELVTREEIAEALWQDQGTVDVVAGINTAIKRLRTQLGDSNGNGMFIETVVGVGYRFAAPVSQAEVVEPTALASAASRQRRYVWPALAGVLVLLAVACGWMVYSSRKAAKTADTPFLLHSHPVTFDELEDQLTAQAVSPTGIYVAYSDRTGITLHTLTAGGDRHLDTPGSLQIEHIAWTPDDSALLVSGTAATTAREAAPDQGGPQTWRIPLGGQPAQLLLEDAALATVSPTDGRIAALRARQTEVWIYGPNGDSARRLLKAPYGDTFTCLLWSPRGDRIIVDHARPRLPSLAGADLNAKDGSPAGGGNRQDGSSYETYDAKSGALLNSRDGVAFDSAALLPDGSLLYPVNAPGQEATLAVMKTNPATGAVLAAEQLLPSYRVWSAGFDHIAQLSASADGKTVSALLDRAATDVFTADFIEDTSGANASIQHIARLTRHASSGYPTAWSPDGSEVVFDDGIAGPITIAAQRLDGSRMQVLADSKSNQEKFAQGQFSPDGRWLLFLNLAMDSGHVQSIERVAAHGGVPEVVHTTGQIEEFHCSSSSVGRCVLREVEGKKHLTYYALDPERGIGEELARTPWEPNLLGDWTISPDGTTVAMAHHDSMHPGIQLVVLPPATSRQRVPASVQIVPLAGFGTTLASHWSSDGKGFFVETYTGKQYDLVWVTLDGHANLLAQSPQLLWAIPSPDGKKIAFPGRTPLNRNVWIGTAQVGTPH